MSIEENLRAVDVLVIVSLWALQFLDNWLQALFEHTSKVIYGDFMESEFFERYEVYLLFGKCALACVVAFIVDAYNHKFVVAFGGMATYILTPVFALCMCITEKRIFSMLTLAVSSILFATSPAAFGVIFNQKKSPIRVQVRRLVSIMEFVDGVLLIIIGETIPDTAVHSERYSMIANWVVVIPFFIFILTILERIRKYVSPDRLRERGVLAIFKGIHNDISGKAPKTGLSKMNLLFFVFLLLPAFSLTTLESVVSNLKSENDTQFQHPSLKKTITFGQLTVIPICEVGVSFSPLSELLAEMLVLGLAHVLNIGVLTYLVVRMNTRSTQRPVYSNFDEEFPRNHSVSDFYGFPSTAESSSQELDDPRDRGLSSLVRVARDTIPPPGEKRFVFFILNPTPINVTLEDDPRFSLFGLTNTFLRPLTGALYNDRNMTDKEETISIIVKPTPSTAAPSFVKTIKFEENKFYFLIMTGNRTKLDMVIAGDDVDVPEFLQKSILIVQNTFVGNEYWGRRIEEDHELQVSTETGSTIYIETLPDRARSLSLVVPEGVLRFTIRYLGNDPIIRQKLRPIAEDIGRIEPSTFNIISITVLEMRERYYISVLTKIFEIKPPTTTPAPPEPDQPDAALQTAYTVIGATIGLTSVGYIHFFWMGCPIRLRATLYAWFLASNEILGWVAAYVVGHEIGVEEGIGLLIIAIFTAIWHFVFGWYYEHKIMPEALKQRRLPSTALLN